MKTWSCKIGEVPDEVLPSGADLPMRRAVAAAYREITGQDDAFIFSGWGAELTPAERAVVENRVPEQDTPAPDDLLYDAWCLIANVSEGDWRKQPSGWQEAATRWRDLWHSTLRAPVAASSTPNVSDGSAFPS